MEPRLYAKLPHAAVQPASLQGPTASSMAPPPHRRMERALVASRCDGHWRANRGRMAKAIALTPQGPLRWVHRQRYAGLALAVLLFVASRAALEVPTWRALLPAAATPHRRHAGLETRTSHTNPPVARVGLYMLAPSEPDVLARRIASIVALLPIIDVPCPVRAGGIDAARDQLVAAAAALEGLLTNYDAVVKRGGGDEVRRMLGKVGTGSPLFELRKKCLELAPIAEDPDEFIAALEEFTLALSSADGNAYSSVFAGGSGDPRKNSPAVCLGRARSDVVKMRREVDRMLKSLGASVMS